MESLVNLKEKNLKNLIIETLSSEWPKTAKKVYAVVKSRGINVSYQAVHKSIKNLEENSIVAKTDKGYELSIDWIKHLKYISTKMEAAYSKKAMISDDKPTTLTFESLWDVYLFILECFAQDLFNTGDKSICFQSQHIWHSMVGTDKEWGAIEHFMKTHKIYAVARSNTLLDNIFKKNWERIGIRFKLGVDVQSTTLMRDTVVIGDYIINMFFPEEMVKEENRLYESIKMAEDLDPGELHKFFWKKYKWINLIVYKNKDVADQLRKNTEVNFIESDQ